MTYDKKCQVCGFQFVSHSTNARYCEKCKKEVQKAHWQEWYRKNHSEKREPREFTLRCQVCGAEFTAKCTNAKYCPDCRVKVHHEQSLNYRKIHGRKSSSGDGRDYDRNLEQIGDPPEMIHACLTCTLPPNHCHGRGDCQRLQQVKAERRQKAKSVTDETIRQLLDDGLDTGQIAEQLGYVKTTVQRRIREIREEKIG